MINGHQHTRDALPVRPLEPGAHRHGYTRYSGRQLALLAFTGVLVVLLAGVVTRDALVSLGILLGLSLGWVWGLAG